MKKTYVTITTIVFICLLVVGVSYAAFTDKSKLLGSTFSTGSADIKLLINIASGATPDNLADEKPGPEFTGIAPFWQQEYLLKIYNNSSSTLNITSRANYTTANDPDELRQYIYVEPIEWNDSNGNGIVEADERGASHGRMTITRWKNDGIELGNVSGGQIQAWILTFSTDNLSDAKQGKSAIFDFEFDSIAL